LNKYKIIYSSFRFRIVIEPSKPALTSSEMALLLSLPPPPPPPSPPPPSSFPPHPSLSTNEDDKTLQLFYAQLNCDQSELMSSVSNMEKTSMVPKSEQQQQHHHHHHHKDKKSVRNKIQLFQ